MTELMTTKLSALKDAVKALNDAITEGKATKSKEEAATAALTAINNQIVTERVAALRAMPAEQMWADYLDNQFCKAYSISKADKETGLHSIVCPTDEHAATVRVSFNVLNNDKDNNLARIPHWNTMLRIFCENVVVATASDCGREYVTRNKMSQALVDERSKMGEAWQPKSGTFSMNALVKMLNEVVFAIIPDDACKPMIKADVKYISRGLIVAKKSKTDEAGQFAVRNMVTMEDFLFRAIYTRRNGLAYAFQNKQEKESNSNRKPEEEGLPGEYIEIPEAGEVKISEVAVPAEESAAE